MGSAGDFIRKIAQESARLAYNDFVRLTEGSAIGSWFVGLVSPDKTKITHPSGYVYNLQYTGQIRQYQLACIVTSSLAYAPGTGAIRTSMIDGAPPDAYILASNAVSKAYYVFKLGDVTPYKWLDIPTGYVVEPSTGTKNLYTDMTPDGKNLVSLDWQATNTVSIDGGFSVSWTFTVYKNFSVGKDGLGNPIVNYTGTFSSTGSQTTVSGSTPVFYSYVNNAGQTCIDMVVTFLPPAAVFTGGLLPGTITYYQGICPESGASGSTTSADPNIVLGFSIYPHANIPGYNFNNTVLSRSINNVGASLYNTFLGSLDPHNGIYYSTPATAVASFLGNPHPSSPVVTDQIYLDLINLDTTCSGNTRYGRVKAVDSLLFYDQQMIGVNSDTVNWDIQIATYTYDPIAMTFTKNKSKKGKCIPLQQNDNTNTFNGASQYLPVSFAIRGGVPHVN